MKPKERVDEAELFRSRLDQILNRKHPLFVLAGKIDWAKLNSELADAYDPRLSRPAKQVRLLVGLHYLQYAYGVSDERAVELFLENPYWQFFCGFDYFRHALPLAPTTLVK